jgi:hypothetical protein
VSRLGHELVERAGEQVGVARRDAERDKTGDGHADTLWRPGEDTRTGHDQVRVRLLDAAVVIWQGSSQ